MGKVHSITSIIAVIFIAVLLFLMIHPMDFMNKNLEDSYHSNEGLIWLIGLVLGVLIAWRTYANSTYQNEIKKKNDLISTQNSEIIKNELANMRLISQLNKDINENSKRDNETMKLFNELAESVQSLHRRIEDSEKKIHSHDLKIEKLSIK